MLTVSDIEIAIWQCFKDPSFDNCNIEVKVLFMTLAHLLSRKWLGCIMQSNETYGEGWSDTTLDMFLNVW